MRPLGNYEKKIVKKLCENHQFFSDIFERDFLKDLIIEMTDDPVNCVHEVKFLMKNIDSHKGDYIKEKMYEATDLIVQTINLINYLDRQAYIYSFTPAHRRNVHTYIGLKETIQDYLENTDKYTGTLFSDSKSYGMFFEFTNVVFASTESLKDYYKSGYRTLEQKRHRQNVFISWAAIIISIIIGLIGVFN